MLEGAGGEAPLDLVVGRAVPVEPPHPHVDVAVDRAPQVGHGQAALVDLDQLVVDGLDDRVDHDGQRDAGLVGVAGVVVDLDDGDAPAVRDLVGGQPGAVGVPHGVDEVVDQGLDLGRGQLVGRHLDRGLAQGRVADGDDLPDGHAARSQRTGNSGWSSGGAVGQLVLQPGERRRGRPRTGGVDHVVAQEAHREHPPPGPGLQRPARPVEHEHVEEDGVARLEGPGQDRVALGVALDVGQLGQRPVGEPLGLAVQERPRHVPRPPVGAGDELEGRLPGHRVDREPQADVLVAGDVVVRQVLVPGGALAGAGLLDQDVVVEEADGRGAHQLAGDGGGGGVPDEALHGRDAVPRAEVLDEGPVVRAAGPLGQRREVGQVGLDRGPGQLDVGGGEGLPHADGAVAPEVALDPHAGSMGMRTPRSSATSRARS